MRPTALRAVIATTAVVLLVLCTCPDTAAAAPYTAEANERLLLPNFALGWTTVGSDFRVTVQLVDAVRRSWIAVGTSQGNGLGESAFTTGATAVIAGPSGLDYNAQEYELIGEDPATGVLPWTTTGPTAGQIFQCVMDVCPASAARCQSNPACADALQCVSPILLTNGTDVLDICTTSLGTGETQQSLDAIGALLDTLGCFFTNCVRDVYQTSRRVTNLKTVSAFQVQNPFNLRWNSTLTFTASRIGYIALNDRPITLIAGFGSGNFSEFVDPSHESRISLSVNLNRGSLEKQPVPAWVQAHAAFMTLSLGILAPTGIILKAFRLRGHAAVQVSAMFLALIGGFIGGFFVNITTKAHHMLGITVLIMLVVQPIGVFFRSPDGVPGHHQAGLQPGDGSKLLEGILGKSKAEVKQLWGMLHTLFGYTIIILAIVNSFLGASIISNSHVSSSGLVALPIIFVVSGSLALLASSASKLSLWKKLGRRNLETTAADSGILASSSNPQFHAKGVSPDDALETMGQSDDSEPKVLPCYLVFKNVSYRAPPGKKERKEGATSGKLILSQCSGFCAPGTLTAIMGPSGSGKTSLLDILAGRSRLPPEADAVVEVNGVATHLARKLLANQSGYVLQEDVLHQYLSVYETLMVTARLILPPSFTDQQRYDRVIRVIAQLGLGHALDTKIGGAEVRGLSGGERRRVSVGIQIIKSPSLLFLDEPTSGLDSSTAAKLVQSLRDLANEGRTVIATIHQPSVQIFNIFDRLVLLSAGKMVWSGSRTSAERFFSTLHRDIPSKWNPADWYLLVVDVLRNVHDDDTEEGDDQPGEKPLLKAPEHHLSSPKTLSYKLTSPSVSKQRPTVRMSALRLSVAAESRHMDVATLTEVVRQFYSIQNPAKLKQHPEIVDEVVKYAMRKGVSELERKLKQTYGVGITAILQQKQNDALVRARDKPWTMAQLDEAVHAFSSTPEAEEIDIRLKRCREDANKSGQVLVDDIESEGIRIRLGQQIRILSERGALLAWRDPQVLRFQAVQNIAFGLVLGSLYSNLRHHQSQAYTLSMAMAIILGIVAMITIALGTAVAFSDKQVFIREQSDYLYSPVAHFFSRLFVGAPISLVVAACLILPAYFWIGLDSNVQGFFFFFAVNIAMIFLFDGIVGVTVLLANDVTTAFGMGNFYEAISIFMSGIFIPYPLIPPFWAWLYWITPFSYAYAAVAINEFEGTENEFWLYALGLPWRSKWGNLLIVVMMGVIWRLVGLGLAIRVNRHASRNVKPKTE